MTRGSSTTIARDPGVQGAAPAAFPRGQFPATDTHAQDNHGTQVTSAS